MDSLLTTEDVAEYFRMDVATVRRMIGKQELTAYRVGGEYRFKQADIDEYLERQRLPAHPGSIGHFGKLTDRARKFVPGGANPGDKDRLRGDKFDHFTKRAQRVMALAQEEAQHFNHNYIGTEHLLLGLVKEGEGAAAQVLSNLGIEATKLRSAVELIIGRGEKQVTGEIGLTPRAKKVIELGHDEAHRLSHEYIGTEHLLLGLIREGDGVAATVLGTLGVKLEQARAELSKVVAAAAGPREN